MHKEIPQTDPESEEGIRPQNLKHNLCLWKKNEYQDGDEYLKLIEQNRKLMPSEKSVLEWRINTRLDSMRKLEHHFRLQSIILSREKKLEKDFPQDLLRI